MGVEFQSAEGLVVVSDSESEPEGMPSAVGSSCCLPASPSEPGLVGSAGGIGPVLPPPRAKAMSSSAPRYQSCIWSATRLPSREGVP